MPTTPADVTHLWSRAAFGIDAAGAAARAGRPWDELVEELVAPAAAPMARPTSLDDPAMMGSEFYRSVGVARAWLDHMAATPTPGAEKLCWFWHNHFTTSMIEVSFAQGVFLQLEMLRNRGQGPFRDLLGDVVVDSAMSLYLDNVSNVKGALNENFARELLELFTVGVDHYTQDDVLGAARSMTGHNVDWSGSLRPTYYPTLHDDGVKTVLGSTGRFDGPGLCDVICNPTNRVLVARRVAARLWSAWAFPDPGPALVDELATSALAGGFSGRSFARAVLLHPEFCGERARTEHLRTPLEIAIALSKLAGVAPSALSVQTVLSNAGHFPYVPPNVGGWPDARSLLSPQAWWQLGNLHVSTAYTAAAARPSRLPVTASLDTTAAAKAMLAWAGVVDPDPATVAGMATYAGRLRTASPASEPMSLAMAATLSPDFTAGGTTESEA